MRRPARSFSAATAALVATAGLLSGCSGQGDPPEDAADELAAALASGTLPSGLFVGGAAQEEYDAAVEGLDPARPTVEVAEVREDDDTAVATLDWAWDVEGHRWS